MTQNIQNKVESYQKELPAIFSKTIESSLLLSAIHLVLFCFQIAQKRGVIPETGQVSFSAVMANSPFED